MLEFNYSLVVISSLFMYTYVLVIFSLANRIAYVLSNNIITRFLVAPWRRPRSTGSHPDQRNLASYRLWAGVYLTHRLLQFRLDLNPADAPERVESFDLRRL